MFRLLLLYISDQCLKKISLKLYFLFFLKPTFGVESNNLIDKNDIR